MLRLAFDFIITWRETRTRPNAYSNLITNFYADQKKRLLDKGFNIGMSYEGIEEMRNKYLK